MDACYGRALRDDSFSREEIVCVKTLYNYIDSGLITIKNHNLPEKLKRKPMVAKLKENKRKLGRSIEERPESVNIREEFGHWNSDLVIGSKKKDDDVLLTLIERMTREYIMIPLSNKEADTILKAFLNLQGTYSEHFNEVFKTITTDNGSEFATLSELESVADTLIYYAHPY